MSLKIAIITVVLNGQDALNNCVKSVLAQKYPDIEYIIIDGGSTDGTLDIIKSYGNAVSTLISEPDKGIYDAMNKGLRLAKGDIIGILNSDDIYANENVIGDVVKVFEGSDAETCYSDLVYVDRLDTDKVIRYWKAGPYNKELFKKGWMPPHPTFFVRKRVYEKYGYFNLDFPLAADYELMLRFLYKYNVSATYIPKVLVKMRAGGTSRLGIYTIKSFVENYRSWTVNDLRPGFFTLLRKPFSKLGQYFDRTNNELG
jgi:glycosyltransferase involved in cell wall biosynthesis